MGLEARPECKKPRPRSPNLKQLRSAPHLSKMASKAGAMDAVPSDTPGQGTAGEGQRLQREKGISVGEPSAVNLKFQEAWHSGCLLYFANRAQGYYTQPPAQYERSPALG